MNTRSLLFPTNTGVTGIELGSSSLHSKYPLYEPPHLPESICIFRDLRVIFKHAKVPLAIPGTGDIGFDEGFLSQVNFNPEVRVPETHVHTKP